MPKPRIKQNRINRMWVVALNGNFHDLRNPTSKRWNIHQTVTWRGALNWLKENKYT